VPAVNIGQVLGRGGGQIKWIREKSGAKIFCDKIIRNDNRHLRVRGTKRQISHARKMIQERLEEVTTKYKSRHRLAPPTGWSREEGEDNSERRGDDRGEERPSKKERHARQEPPPGQTREVIPLPHSLYSKIVGKAGSTIKDIRQKSGADINTNKEPECCKVIITGSKQAISNARDLIFEVLTPSDYGVDEIEVRVLKAVTTKVFDKGRLDELAEQTGTTVTLQELSSDAEYNAVCISGMPRKVAEVKDAIIREAQDASRDGKEDVSEDGHGNAAKRRATSHSREGSEFSRSSEGSTRSHAPQNGGSSSSSSEAAPHDSAKGRSRSPLRWKGRGSAPMDDTQKDDQPQNHDGDSQHTHESDLDASSGENDFSEGCYDYDDPGSEDDREASPRSSSSRDRPRHAATSSSQRVATSSSKRTVESPHRTSQSATAGHEEGAKAEPKAQKASENNAAAKNSTTTSRGEVQSESSSATPDDDSVSGSSEDPSRPKSSSGRRVVDNAGQNAESTQSVTASDQQAEAGRSRSPAGQASRAGTSRTSDAAAKSGGRCKQSSANPTAAESSSDVSSTGKADEKADAADETTGKADAEERSTQPGASRAEDEENHFNHPGLQSCAKAKAKSRPASKVTSTDESGATSLQGDSGEHVEACGTEAASSSPAADGCSSQGPDGEAPLNSDNTAGAASAPPVASWPRPPSAQPLAHVPPA